VVSRHVSKVIEISKYNTNGGMILTQPLVVFYSRTGSTKKVGELIAQKLNCETEEIIDNKNRSGFIGLAGGVINPSGPTTIRMIKKNPRDYDIVIIGTPIWWYSLAPAVKTYLEKYRFGKVAFFFTCEADKKNTAFEDMGNISGVTPVATLRIDKRDKKDLDNSKKIDEFVDQIITSM